MRLELVCILLCSFSSATFAEDTLECPEGFLQHRNACYWFSNIKGSFAEAIFFRSRLVQITSTDENDFIVDQAGKTGRANYWLGATDFMVRGTFFWEGSLALNYTNWIPGEPNNLAEHGKPENCVYMRRDSQYRWNNVNCDTERPFICETRVFGRCFRKQRALTDESN